MVSRQRYALAGAAMDRQGQRHDRRRLARPGSAPWIRRVTGSRGTCRGVEGRHARAAQERPWQRSETRADSNSPTRSSKPISCAASTGSDRIQVRHDRRQTDHRWPITGPVRLECRVEPNIGRRQGPQPPLSRTWPTPTVSSKRPANPERFWHAFPRGSVPTWGIPDATMRFQFP